MVIAFEDIGIFLSSLAQRLHVTHDRIQVSVAQLHGGHQRAGFDCTGVLDPKTEIVVSVFWRRLRQSWRGSSNASGRGQSAHPRRFRPLHGSSCRHCFQILAYLRLRLCLGLRDSAGHEPSWQILGSIHRNAEQHLRMLCSAVLCTLARKTPVR